MITLQHVEALMAAGGTIEQVAALMRVDEELRAERRRIRAERAASRVQRLAEGQSANSASHKIGDAFAARSGEDRQPLAGLGDVTSVTPVTVVTPRRDAETVDSSRSGPGQPPSKGALRTRRWRERRRNREVERIRAHAGAVGVLRQSDSVTSVTHISEVTPAPGRTPLKGVQPPAAQGRHRGGTRQKVPQRQLPLVSIAKIDVHATDPLFAELQRMEGRTFPISERSGGWSFDPELVARAARNIAARATGPPIAATG